MRNIKVIIADDHQLFRKGMIAVIKDIKGIKVIDQAEHGLQLLEKLEEKIPDIILMDIKMPIMDGIEATQKVIASYPEIKVIMLTMHDDEKFITHLVEIGAHGYLLKNTDIKEVSLAIKQVMSKGYYFNDSVSEVVMNSFLKNRSKKKITVNKDNNLSKREFEVLKLICEGYTNSEIADKLFLSTRTVEGYRYKLCDKTGVKNTAGLVRYALKSGLVD